MQNIYFANRDRKEIIMQTPNIALKIHFYFSIERVLGSPDQGELRSTSRMDSG